MEDLFNQLDRPVDLYVTYAVIISCAHVGDAISRAMKAPKKEEKRNGERENRQRRRQQRRELTAISIH